MKKRNALISLVVCALCAAIAFALTSCGSTNSGPAVGTFKTVTIIPSVATPLLPVKVFEGGTCTNNTVSGTVSVTIAQLPVTLTSTLYPNETAGQPVTVPTYDVYFTPLDGGPAIGPFLSVGLGASIPAGGSATANINLVDASTIATIQANTAIAQCSVPKSFHYTAQIIFHGIELGGTEGTFTAFTDVTYENSI